MLAQQKNQTLREKVFSSAWSIVESQGMDELSVRGIAEKSECTLGAIYDVLENFEDLQLRINARILTIIYQEFDSVTTKAIDENKSLKELLRNLGTSYVLFAQKNKFLWKALFEYSSSHFPNWYTKHIHEGIHLVGARISKAYNLPESHIRKTLGFFWASIHGICSVLLNKNLDRVAELFCADLELSSYIEYCLSGLMDEELSSVQSKSRKEPLLGTLSAQLDFG